MPPAPHETTPAAPPLLLPFCPAPPDWGLRWPEIEVRFGWLQVMAGVPQEPDYHAEGDVLVHTRMVVEALVALEEWRDLVPADREALLLAALMHDIAKPVCTRTEADGRITSPSHVRRGAAMARSLLWSGRELSTVPPLAWREAVARLVRFHGLPLWFLEKPDPRRAVIEASQSARLDRVALLAEADVRGRLCRDQAELLERVALFREFCRENHCYDRPRPFASDHSRFLYFRRPAAEPDFEAYDDTVGEVVLMAGLPGAGKDTWIRAHRADWPVISLDQIRAELRIDPAGEQGRVIAEAGSRARQYLRQQRSFVWNATNVTRSLRASLINLFATYRARVRIVYVDAPFPEILDRNQRRRQGVPERVLRALLDRLEPPDLTEAHQVDWVTG